MNQYEAYSEIKICEVLHSKVIYNYMILYKYSTSIPFAKGNTV